MKNIRTSPLTLRSSNRVVSSNDGGSREHLEVLRRSSADLCLDSINATDIVDICLRTKCSESKQGSEQKQIRPEEITLP